MILRSVLLLVVLSVGLVGAVWGQYLQVYLDFDDDGDEWTIRTELPEGEMTGAVKVILEVGETVPEGQGIEGWISEGCCVLNEVTYYGTWGSFGFEGYFSGTCFWSIPEGDPAGWPCPGPHFGHGCTFSDSLPFAPGERYFIGSGVWEGFCCEPCDPPTQFDYQFSIAGEEVGSGTMRFHCEPPTAIENASWGSVKGLYR